MRFVRMLSRLVLSFVVVSAAAACGPTAAASPSVASPATEPSAPLAAPPTPVEALPPTLPALRVDRRLEGEPSWLVVLLHGYGSDPVELELLAQTIAVPPATRVLIPRAPLDGPGVGRAWWPLDPNRITARQRDPHVLEREDPPGLASSSALVRELVTRERGSSRVVLAGFSQGGMLAVDVAIALDPPPDALIVVAGALLARERLTARMPAASRMHVMVAHGKSDGVVPFVAAGVLRDAFIEAGFDVRFTAYDGGHAAEPHAIEDVDRFLYELSGTASTL